MPYGYLTHTSVLQHIHHTHSARRFTVHSVSAVSKYYVTNYTLLLVLLQNGRPTRTTVHHLRRIDNWIQNKMFLELR